MITWSSESAHKRGHPAPSIDEVSKRVDVRHLIRIGKHEVNGTERRSAVRTLAIGMGRALTCTIAGFRGDADLYIHDEPCSGSHSPSRCPSEHHPSSWKRPKDDNYECPAASFLGRCRSPAWPSAVRSSRGICRGTSVGRRLSSVGTLGLWPVPALGSSYIGGRPT